MIDRSPAVIARPATVDDVVAAVALARERGVPLIGDEGVDRVKAAFGPERYARLQEIKRAWDPDNLFRLNQNIPPN